MQTRRKNRPFNILSNKGAGLVEYGLLAGLVAVVSIGTAINLGGDVRSTFSMVNESLKTNTFEARVEGGLARYPATCVEGTSGTDLFVDVEFEEFDCLEMFEGNDEYQTGLSDVSGHIFPGKGSDYVRWVQSNPNLSVTYEGGNDTYSLRGGTVNLPFSFSEVTLAYETAGGISESFTMMTPNGRIEFPYSLVSGAFSMTQSFAFTDQTFSGSEMADAIARTRVTSGSDMIYTSNKAEEISPGAGDDTVEAGDGSDTVIYTSGNDVYRPGRHEDVLVVPYAQSEVHPYIWDNQSNLYIEITATGDEIYVPGQYSNTNSSGQDVHFYQFEFTDGTLSWDDMRILAVSGNTTSAADTVYGSTEDDNFVIENSSGRDWLQGNGGDDMYTYITGDAYLKNRGGGTGDTLDLSNWSSDEVSFSVGAKDGYITVPAKGASSGGVISLEKINTMNSTNSTHPVEYIVFSDKTMDHIEMRSEMGITLP